ncbi:ATP-binding cassette domain-containing protein, partial [Escherichia coli]
AEENIAVPALDTSMSERERTARVRRLAFQLGLENRLRHRPAELSGGQQQRVSICRALINGAHVILADEPTGALDSTSGKALMGVLHQLHADGHTVIIVTHDRDVAREAQRIIEIGDGRIISDVQHAEACPSKPLPEQDNGRA